MRAILAIIAKEFSEILRNRVLVFSSLLPAVIFTVMPLLVGLRGTNRSGRSGQLTLSQMGEIVNHVSPELHNLPAAALAQIFIFRQFAVLMLFVPIITALAIAAHSIIGEKQARSLEPLLATPVSTMQLLVAKSLSAVFPAVGLTWIVFTIYSLAIKYLALPEVLPNVLTMTTLLLILVICPLVATLGLSLGVVVSSRANDPRTAQQIGGVFVLPLMAIFIAQMQGLYFLTLSAVMLGIVALVVIDAVVLGVGVALFDRETILVRWK